MVKLGLIGIGHVASAQVEALSLIDGLELVSAHDISAEREAYLPEGVLFWRDLDDFLCNANFDLCLISVPNRHHFPIALKALQNGVNCVVEKPATETASDLTKLVEEAEARGLFFDIALHAAHAFEVKWWVEKEKSFGLGPLTGFRCGFFDPYIQKGQLLERALGLGGSWFDSGINALSVVARFLEPDNLTVREAQRTKVPQIECSELEGHCDFSFWYSPDKLGWGRIDTNWTLGVNKKVTTLLYGESGHELELHHSLEHATLRNNTNIVHSERFSTDTPRLSNHYIGVFREIVRRFKSNDSNISWAREVHQVFFDAIQQSETSPAFNKEIL